MREVKSRYRQSYLGIAWAILQPLSLTILFAIVFTRFIPVSTEGIPYPLFAYTAVLPWTYFAACLSSATPSVVNNLNLVTKIYFPREILPFASVGARTVDFLCGVGVLLGLLAYYRVECHLSWLTLPLILFVQIVLTLGLTLFTAALNVAFRDVGHVIPVAIQLWMYATPVIYPIALVPERYRLVYMLNPMAGIIESYRATILHGLWPTWLHLGIAALISTLVLVGGYLFFKSAERSFADII